MPLTVPVVRLDPELPLPSYARLGDAGADLVARVGVLRSAGVEVNGLEKSHDFLDAALVALVARHRSLGTARVATCGHDQSGIWLPAA